MSEIIRSGGVGPCALALFLLASPLVVATRASAQDAGKAAPVQGTAAASQVLPPAPADTPEPTGKGKGSKAGKNMGGGQVTASGVQKDPYVIGPEDLLGLNVLHQQDVTQNLEVRPDGFVSVRFAGEIKAAGLTTQQLADVVTEKLKTYFNNPEVNIQVLRINSKKYYISGGVKRPGSYALTSPITIYEALISAGGLTEFAKKNRIYVLRGRQKFNFNFKDVSKGTHLDQNILLQNGDVITVPE